MAAHSSFSATEGFTVLFWLELASPHILPLCRALANYPNIQVVVVYINDADSARLTQGWVQCSLDGLFSFRLTSEFELSTILASLPRQLDPIHIFQGIRIHPAFASHYSFCRASRHLILHYQEQLLLHGSLAIVRYICYYAVVNLLRSSSIGYLLIGAENNRLFRSLFVFRSHFSFCYFSQVVSRRTLAKMSRPLRMASHRETRILFLGQLILRKGIDLLVESVSLLSSAKFRLTICGSGPFAPSVRQLAAIDQRVEIIDSISMDLVPDLFTSHDLLIAPSRFDGWCSVVPEALSFGLRVITSSSVGSSFLVRNHNSGDVIPRRQLSSHALAKSIMSELARHATLGKSLSPPSLCITPENGADYLLTCFSAMANQLQSKHPNRAAVVPNPPWLRSD